MKKRAFQGKETYHYKPEKMEVAKGLKRVAAYCRVSTLAEEQELSFETQCDYYRNLIDNDPTMTLVGIYGDQGFSGLHASQRKEFQRLMKDCMNGKVDMILVKSISRFSRNSVECTEYLRQLKEKGVSVFFEKEKLSSFDTKTDMILSIYTALAQNESSNLSKHLRWAHKRRAEMGDPIRAAPYGYRREKVPVDSIHRWIIVPEEAKRIRRIFDLAYQGYAYYEIRDELNEMEKAEGSKFRWTGSNIKGKLQNEVYRGDILTFKTIQLDYLSKKKIKNTGQVEQYYLEQHHEPIVDPKIFDTVQEYVKQGFLNAWRSQRRAWLEENKEVLAERRKNSDGNGERVF